MTLLASRLRRCVRFGGFVVLSACAGGGSSTTLLPNTNNGVTVDAPAPVASATVSGNPTAVPSAKPTAAPSTKPSAAPVPGPTTKPTTTPSPAPTTAAPSSVTVPTGFTVGVIANVVDAHGLAFLPNGDLLVGSGESSVTIVPQADANAGVPGTFVTLPDAPTYGVAYGGQSIYVATKFALWRIPYANGDRVARSLAKIATFRQGAIAPHSDGDVHGSTSVAVTGTSVFVGIGSSCNACTEVDPTRATVQRTNLDGSGMTTYATRIRNPIALTVDPATGTVWTGGAGQDDLPLGRPYEYLDGLTLHAPVADYGWPQCEENRRAYAAGADCAATVIPRIELPAYSTIMAAAFYPTTLTGPYAFPAAYRGGVFVAAHGSWHKIDGSTRPPRVVFVPMSGDTPNTPVDWNDPTAQWTDFLTGFQDGAGNRIGRPSGEAVGPNGSLFVADGPRIYRIRPK